MSRALAADWTTLAALAIERLGAAGHITEADPRGAVSPATWRRLLELVVAWNARVDLTAARSAEELVDLYLADALVLAAAARASDLPWSISSRSGALGDDERGGSLWIDVGSGGGAPGIPLAMLLPEAKLTLVESRAKRVAFLRTAHGTLGLEGVELMRDRSESLPAGAWDVAVSRATLPPPRWLEEGARLARQAVWVLLARGDAPEHEGWRSAIDLTYRWPLTGVERRALCYVPAL